MEKIHPWIDENIINKNTSTGPAGKKQTHRSAGNNSPKQQQKMRKKNGQLTSEWTLRLTYSLGKDRCKLYLPFEKLDFALLHSKLAAFLGC